MPEIESRSMVAADSSASANGSGSSASRSGPRYPIMAAAEVIELRSNMRISARSTDISSGGCYVDTLNPLPVGSTVGVRIVEANRSFEAQARVIHAQPGMGMGLAFAQVRPEQQTVLRQWLAELGGAPEPPSVVPETNTPPGPAPQDEHPVLGQLISLLVRKGVLTHAEGGTLLGKLRR